MICDAGPTRPNTEEASWRLPFAQVSVGCGGCAVFPSSFPRASLKMLWYSKHGPGHIHNYTPSRLSKSCTPPPPAVHSSRKPTSPSCLVKQDEFQPRRVRFSLCIKQKFPQRNAPSSCVLAHLPTKQTSLPACRSESRAKRSSRVIFLFYTPPSLKISLLSICDPSSLIACHGSGTEQKTSGNAAQDGVSTLEILAHSTAVHPLFCKHRSPP